MQYTPYLFISIGFTGALFTLRETYLHQSVVEGQIHTEVKSFHHFNLSASADEAIEKALAIAEDFGMELRADKSLLESEMRDIVRLSKEQLEERNNQLKAERDDREAAIAVIRQERINEILDGWVNFGAYRGTRQEDLPISYTNFLISKIDTFEQGTLIKLLAEQVLAKWPEKVLPKVTADTAFGEEKKRYTFNDAVLLSRIKFYSNDHFGRPVAKYLLKFVWNGFSIVCFNSDQLHGLEVGDSISFKATAIKFSEYNGEQQTVVNRLKEV